MGEGNGGERERERERKGGREWDRQRCIEKQKKTTAGRNIRPIPLFSRLNQEEVREKVTNISCSEGVLGVWTGGTWQFSAVIFKARVHSSCEINGVIMLGGKGHNRVFCFGVYLTPPRLSLRGCVRFWGAMYRRWTPMPGAHWRARAYVLCLGVYLTLPRIFLKVMDDSLVL